MAFTSADLDAILAATGTTVIIKLLTVTTKTVIGKFREDYQDIALYDVAVASLIPAVLIKTSDLVGITTSHTFTINSTVYVAAGPFQPRDDGFSLVRLATSI